MLEESPLRDASREILNTLGASSFQCREGSHPLVHCEESLARAETAVPQ